MLKKKKKRLHFSKFLHNKKHGNNLNISPDEQTAIIIICTLRNNKDITIKTKEPSPYWTPLNASKKQNCNSVISTSPYKAEVTSLTLKLPISSLLY